VTPLDIDELARMTLREDLSSGDLTTEATVATDARGRAVAIAKSPLVACGGALFRRVFALLDPHLTFEAHVADGADVAIGQPVWTVEGNARALLEAERSALNLTQRASGIATMARRFVKAAANDRVRITDTRKTTPGLRALERYAVRVGGAYNHRDNLGAAVLIKDNHIVAAGGVTKAIRLARARAPHTTKIEVEVADLHMLDEALAAGADIVMLDNFELADVVRGVERVNGRALIEVSGGVTLQTVAELAATGVDAISVGALTHSAPAADISLQLSL